MKNPTMLYRCPGNEVFEGVACETTVVDEDQLEAAKADGWCTDWMKADAARKEAEAAQAAELAANEAELADLQKKLDASGLRAVHKGRGKYDVLNAAGEVVASGLSKEEAQAKAGG